MEQAEVSRERLKSRLGFLMLAAGSAVGLGNVWRFPFIVGKNGGAAFVLVYLAFLALLGFPLLCAELAIGRGAKRTLAAALGELAPPRRRTFWRRFGSILAGGCFILMIYYTDVSGWLLKFAGDYARGAAPALPGKAGSSACMLAVVAIGAAVCFAGVVKGVERVTKVLMISLLALLAALAARALALPGAAEGLAFYLKPDWARFMEHPWSATFDAMGQAFFTLSLGIGSMTVCGSYTGENRSLVNETAWIIAIDTAVAILAGLVIFPACATYGVPYTSGPDLIFAALPKVFAQMSGGRAWGFLFFVFLACAALTTVIAVFECLIAGLMDSLGWRRLPATLAVGAGVAVLSLPCVLVDGVLAWEDFAVSQIWLPVGALAQGIFVVNGRIGWGWENFRREVSSGRGWRLPAILKYHMAFGVPLLIIAVLVAGLLPFIQKAAS
ncbi:MAG: sodium-dependent transporter [Kiritimatiellae bacterium]|nr:sodium-dependent transporter [Kiritimatiellia bacterium]